MFLNLQDSPDKDISKVVDDGIDFLYNSQLDYGEFKVIPCEDAQMSVCEKESSLGHVAIIDALHGIKNKKVDKMAERAIGFWLSEQLPEGVWKYYSSKDKKDIHPDVDTSSITFNTIKKYGSEENITYNEKLIENNIGDNGLYYTWITPFEDLNKTWWGENDIDCVVNINVLRNLHKNNPNICAFLNDSIENKKQCSIYYEYEDKKRLPAYYFISKAYIEGVSCVGESSENIINYIIKNHRKNGSFGNELETAYAVNILINFNYKGFEIDDGVKYLLKKQHTDGSWETAPAWSGPNKLFYGSEEFTTAIAVEALNKYLNN